MARKGYSYLLISSIIIAIVLIVYLTAQRYTFQDKQDITEIRIKTINDFIKGFNDDIQRATYISSFRAFLALEDHVAQSGEFFNNTEDAFVEIFYNGTINGEKNGLLNGSSFKDYIDKVNYIANNMGINTSMKVTGISIEHVDPWRFKVDIDMNIEVRDTTNIAKWIFNKTFSTEVPIYDLRDPIYTVNTNNRVPNTVIRSPYSYLVNNTNNDTTNLIDVLNNSYYIESTDAPSFLMRFENNTSASVYGIESIVNIKEISDQEIAVYTNRVKVDYIYFNDLSSTSTKICNVDNIPSSLYFVIPLNRKTTYELGTLNYSTSCP